MSYDETLVATVAMIVAIIAALIAIGPWAWPYQLRTIAAVRRRYGKPAARACWIVIAVSMFAASLAIISGMRPTYAVPVKDVTSRR